MAERSWSDPPAWARRLLSALPWLLVTGLGLALLWPVPTGSMPLSADHTVHLTRIELLSDQLAQGQVRGWSTTWFFGTPVGELYPVLGDLVIVVLHALSFGALSWPAAYALGFSLVFLVQGWALLRVGRAMGLGPLPGLVAALLVMADVGAYREGGWMYTVTYGVWPQALATALTWLALAELCVACQTDDPVVRRRRIGTTGLAMGGALLAHPMAMMSFALGGPLLVLTLGVGSRAALRKTTAVALMGAVLGVALAAWWLVPMLQHRAWMASYGWMWMPLDRMAAQAAEGHWTQAMPAAVGAAVGGGLVLLAIFGTRPARLFAAFALVQWLIASRDTLWSLRLDHLSEGFTHLQYQRFLITAKPGLFLAAGACVALLVRAAALAWRRRAAWGKPVAAALGVSALVLAGWMAVGQRDAGREHGVGEVQLQRIPNQPAFDAAYRELIDWMRTTHAEDQGPPYRATVLASRNIHWFMDAPALTGMRIFKQGFTPGDNFVHKPEAGPGLLLDRLRVRYVIATRRRGLRGATEVARFDPIRVLERTDWEQQPIAWVDGPGQVEVLEEDVDGGVVRVKVSGAEAGTRVVFGVAGFPRWELTRQGQPIEWIEVPVVGDGPAATQADRRSGQYRGGKAHGDDGTEPTLIAADVTDGELTLRYQARRGTDMLAGLLSLLALGLCIVLLARPQRWPRPTAWANAVVLGLGRLGHPLLLGGLVLVLVLGAVRARMTGHDRERNRAIGWVANAVAQPGPHVRAGLLKADMLIRPAVLVDPRRTRPASITFPGVLLGERLSGWVALDDDAAKQRNRGRHTFRVEVVEANGSTKPVTSLRLPHRPGQHQLDLDTALWTGQHVDLRVTIDSEGRAPPALGFDLDLGNAP